MHAPDLLSEFSQRTGLPPIVFSESGTARVLVDDTLAIDWQHDADARQLHLMISFGPPPEGDARETYLLRLLAANLLGRETSGAVFAFDASVGDVLLTRTLDLESTDSVGLENALTDLVGAAENLRTQLAAPSSVQTSSDEKASEGFLRA